MRREESEDKTSRVLSIYTRLREGRIVNKAREADKHGVTERSIQRDIEDIRCFLQGTTTEMGEIQEIIFDKEAGGYRLQTRDPDYFEAKEILAVCKVMLESRSLVREEMFPIMKKLLKQCPTEKEEQTVKKLIANEMYHYLEVNHKKRLLERVWLLETAVKEQRYLKIRYHKLKRNEVVERTVKPVGVMFSEFYFYLTAFIEDIDRAEAFQNPDDMNPTIYRVDRLEDVEVLDRHFSIPYRDRFEEGEFRKRVQFMYGGRLRRVKLKCKEQSLEAVLDRLPTAEIMGKEKDGYVVQAEVFGDGIERWLKGQENVIEII